MGFEEAHESQMRPLAHRLSHVTAARVVDLEQILAARLECDLDSTLTPSRWLLRRR